MDWFDPEARCRHIPLSDSQAGAFGRQFLSFSFGPVEVCRPICDGLTTAKSNPQEWEVGLDLVWVPDTFRKESSKVKRWERGERERAGGEVVLLSLPFATRSAV